MEATTLNVAAPPFQPGGGFSGNPPTARQPSPLQMPPSASGQATPLQERNGQQMVSCQQHRRQRHRPVQLNWHRGNTSESLFACAAC